MHEDKGSEILHYKRGMYYINKLIDTFPSGEYVQKYEDDFFEKQYHRFKHNKINIRTTTKNKHIKHHRNGNSYFYI